MSLWGEGTVLVDFTLHDSRARNAFPVLGFEVVDNDDFERIETSVRPDSVDRFPGRFGLWGDDEILEPRLRCDPGRLIEPSDLESAVVTITSPFEFAFEIALSLLERTNMAFFVACLRCQLVARETDCDSPELERPIEQLPMTVVNRIERPP